MKARILMILGLLGCFICRLKCQVGYGFNAPLQQYCSPGVENKSRSRGLDFSYQYSGISRLNGLSERLNSYQVRGIESIIFKVKIPLLLKRDLKILAGYSHEPEVTQVGTSLGNAMPFLQNLNGDYLKNHGMALYAIKSLDATNYLALRFKMTASGSYNGFFSFDKQFVSYSAIGTWGIKRHRDLEYGVGLSFSKNARRTLALPFVFYNKNFNDSWGLEAAIPVNIKLRYNLDDRTIILLGYDLDNRNYGVNLATDPDNHKKVTPYFMNRTSVQAGFNIERQVVPWLWLDIKGGYSFNFNTRLHALDGTEDIFEYQPDNSLFFRMGFFLSPPN